MKGIADADLAAIADARDMIDRAADTNGKERAIHSKRDGPLPSSPCPENLFPK